MEYPRYFSTNESLEGIVESLDLKSDDVVCSVLGSGDQLFAISEFVKDIAGFDVLSSAVEYVEDRFKALNDCDYEKFKGRCLYDEELEFIEKMKYFTPQRFRKIRENRCSVTLVEADILEFIRAGVLLNTTNKFYFSNALTYSTDEPFIDRLEEIKSGLQIGSISYFADSPHSFQMLKVPGFRVLEENSELAREKAQASSRNLGINYSFTPVVLERV